MTDNNHQLRVIDLTDCLEFSNALHCNPNVVIGRSSDTRNRPDAHDTLYYHDKALSATHAGVYLMDELRDRLVLFNASKHGFVHYSWQRDEFSVITANQVATLQSYDMLGLCVVSDFRNGGDGASLKSCDARQLRSKCRFWVRILSDYKSQLIVKTVKGSELNPHLPRQDIEASFLDLCEDFPTYEAIGNCAHVNLDIDYFLSPKLNNVGNEIVLEMCLNKFLRGCDSTNSMCEGEMTEDTQNVIQSTSSDVNNGGLVHPNLFPRQSCGALSKLSRSASKEVGVKEETDELMPKKNIRGAKRSYPDIFDQDGSFEGKKPKILGENETLKRENSHMKVEIEQIRQEMRSCIQNVKAREIKARIYSAIATTAVLYLLGKYA